MTLGARRTSRAGRGAGAEHVLADGPFAATAALRRRRCEQHADARATAALMQELGYGAAALAYRGSHALLAAAAGSTGRSSQPSRSSAALLLVGLYQLCRMRHRRRTPRSARPSRPPRALEQAVGQGPASTRCCAASCASATALLAALWRTTRRSRIAHPRWLLERAADATGRDDWAAIVAANNAHPPMALRVNQRVSRPRRILAALAERPASPPQPADQRGRAWSWTRRCRCSDAAGLRRRAGLGAGRGRAAGGAAARRRARTARARRLLPHRAARPATCSNASRAGELVALDLGRGAAGAGARTTSRVSAWRRRTGRAAMPRGPATGGTAGPFDRILLDAPCSGHRRDPPPSGHPPAPCPADIEAARRRPGTAARRPVAVARARR
ncbi:MAG: hypothetical protein MZV65_54510 [Chromatiales bacterium]|nr:hypothetical protein [Chromatiales bacterium]